MYQSYTSINLLNQALKTEKYNETTRLQTIESNYKKHGSLFLLDNYTEQIKNATPTKVFTVTRYDANGNILEALDKSGIRTSYIIDYESESYIASAQGAAYNDIAYTSFEANGSGNWIISGTLNNSGVTGQNSYNLNTGAISKSGLLSTENYIVSYWTKNNLPFTVTGTQGSVIKGNTNNGWTYFQHMATGQTTVTVSGVGVIDELRLYPSTALMTTYTYKPLIGITSQTDANNRTTYYEYDGFGRLSLVRDQDGNILKKYCYNYAGQVEDCGVDAAPLWQSTGQTRCKACSANSSYLSNIQEHQEKDNNPYSTTYNTFRWMEDGVSSSCVPQADWQQINLYCEQNGSGQYTGNQIRVEKDKNPCSPTYNQTRNISTVNCATCPKPANYQSTGNYRCVKNGSNNNTGAQEREEKDMESCSSTFNQLRWISNGTNCITCPKPQVWQATGNLRCVQVGGVYTGDQEREERNVESCSTGFNDTRWVFSSHNTIDCPRPIYARLSYENVTGTYYGGTYGDVVVRFYSDEGCTMPLSVSGLTINYRVDDGCFGSSSSSVQISGYEWYLGNAVLFSYYETVCNPSCDYRECFVDYFLEPGNGYTIAY